MGSDDTSRANFDLRIISIAAIIALIVGAGTGYMAGNSPLTSLIEERDSLEAEYDTLGLAFQNLEAELASTQESLIEGQRDNALLQERVIELENQIEIQLAELNSTQESLVEEQGKNAILQERVIELGNQIEIQLEAIQGYISTIEALEDEIDELLGPPQTRITINLIGTCTRVIDGDTFELSSGKRVRLADIDAPESWEPGYSASTNALSALILGITVYLDIDDISETDIYGRYVCVVYGAGYTNVNLALLTGGYAVLDDYPNEFDPDDWETPGNLDLSEAPLDAPPEPDPDPEPEPEPEPDPEPDPEPEGIYVGSINSDKYHLPSCYWAGQINPENEIWFTSKSDAESHGYVPCKVCKP